jgi:hypothetical protein
MPGIDPIMTRVAYVTTEHSGGSLDVNGPEGTLQARRVDPHGVVIMLGDRTLSIQKDLLPIMGRFFLAAALLLGEEINAGWDTEQTGAGQ